MTTKKGIPFFMLIIALVTGSKLYKHTNFETWTFEKPAIDTLYLIAFLAAIFVLVKALLERNKARS
jgi:cation transport ATPase